MKNQWFATGNAIQDGNTICVAVFIRRSQSEWLYGTLLGAIEELSHSDSWITGGESTPEEAALEFKNIYDGIKPMLFYIGMVAPFAVVLDANSGWLPCDGAVVYQDDYPELYAVIGSTFDTGGEAGDEFRLPDMRGRIVASPDDGANRLNTAWSDDIGGNGGEDTHTLTESELAAHSHTIPGIVPVVAAPGAIPVNAPFALPGVTGATGGDSAHNNIQPTLILQYHILARY